MPSMPSILTVALAVAVSGCASLLPGNKGNKPSAPVAAVATDYSLGLACLGQMIDRSNHAPITVFVDPIADQTVPERYDNRRLSSGGMWWLHTALNKIDSHRVQAVTSGSAQADPQNPDHVVLAGAWTQDDLEVGGFDAGIDAVLARLGIELGRSQSVDVIAGDFVSSRGGRVVHAAAISVAVSAAKSGLVLQVQDGPRQFGLDFSHSRREGPQFAQRRIAEAAVMVHVARAFDIDYRPCIEADTLAWKATPAPAPAPDTAPRRRPRLQQPAAAPADAPVSADEEAFGALR